MIQGKMEACVQGREPAVTVEYELAMMLLGVVRYIAAAQMGVS